MSHGEGGWAAVLLLGAGRDGGGDGDGEGGGRGAAPVPLSRRMAAATLPSLRGSRPAACAAGVGVAAVEVTELGEPEEAAAPGQPGAAAGVALFTDGRRLAGWGVAAAEAAGALAAAAAAATAAAVDVEAPRDKLCRSWAGEGSRCGAGSSTWREGGAGQAQGST